ncbi:hypothetical protein SDC9_180119 [bioreactor metagenome]|uniref:Uncharacterized protein n=1 Tax=bioreactor metagenome TaxID=1076179 RepID=A0A645H3R9_9ZZZZ
MIATLVHLRTQGMNGGALTRIEHTHLNQRVVRRQSHLAAQRVNLAHKMTLARAADGRIAGH